MASGRTLTTETRLVAVRKTGRRLLTALVVAMFVVAHLSCVCTPRVAFAASPSSAAKAGHARGGEHDCCPQDEQPKGDHANECWHCGGAKLALPPALDLPAAPAAQLAIALPPSLANSTIERSSTSRTASNRGSRALTRPLDRKCVLLI